MYEYVVKITKNMKTLHLNLIKVWFDMIHNSYKTEEYRRISPYWCNKFLLYKGEKQTRGWWKEFMEASESIFNDSVVAIRMGMMSEAISFEKYNTVTFSNGMTPPVPRFEIKLRNFDIGTGNPEWGAEPEEVYFIIKLDNVINE